MVNKRSKIIINQAFTLVELLVVIVIIGILATLSVVALNNSKQKGRDARRVADVKQIQTALEVYYTDNGAYPQYLTAGQVFKDASGKTYLSKVPSNPTPATDGSCPSGDYSYVGPRTDANVYKIYYCLGGAVGSVAGGSCVARPGNICADYIPEPTLSGIVSGGSMSQPSAVTVVGNNAYIGDAGNNGAGLNGFFEIFDISNPASPVRRGRINSQNAGVVALYVPIAIAVVGNYAFVADSSSGRLQVINITDPTNPTAVTNIALNITINDMKVVGRYAYVIGASALKIVDISNPASLSITGSLADGVGSAYLNNANGIYVSGNYAYVAVGQNNSDCVGGLEIINISNPAAPSHVSKLLAGTPLLTHAHGIYVSGNYAYIAAQGSPSGCPAGLEIVNVSDPANPVHAGKLATGTGGAVLDGAYRVAVQGNYAFVSAYDAAAIEVVNISNPAAPTHYATIGSASGASLTNVYDMFLTNYGLYAVGTNSNAFNIINVR